MPESVVVGSTDGTFDPPLRVPITAACLSSCGQASLAGNANGDLLVTWVSMAGGGSQSVWASARLASGGFSAPQRIASHLPQYSADGATDSPVVSAAVGGDGVMVVVFDHERGRLFARVRRGRGAWGRAAAIGPTARYGENDVTSFVSSQGEAVIAWYHAAGTGAGPSGPGEVDVAVLPIGARRFRPAQLLHSDSMALDYAASAMSLAPAVAATPGHAPVTAFIARAEGSSDVYTVVMVAYPTGSGRTNAGSRYSAPVQLSPTQAAVFELQAAAGPAGQILTWTQSASWGSGTSAIMAATTALGKPTGRFQAPEQVSPVGKEADSSAVTFNNASHWPQNDIAPWIVAWLSPSTNETPGAAPDVVVQVAAPLCPAASAGATRTAADPACAGAR